MAQGNRRDEKMRSDRGEWDRKRTGSGNTDKRKKNRRSRPSGRERRAVKKYRLIRSGVLLLFLLTVVLLLRSCIRKVRGTDSMSSDYGTVNVDASEPVIDVQLLDVNPYSRPGTTIDEIHGIVIHYTANPGSTAQENRDYFNGLKDSHETEASSNFVVGLEGEIIQCVPTWEMAYASNERNADTVSIECCHPDKTGKFTKETYQSMVQLTAWLCKKYNLNEDQVIRHYDVTGKICPKYFVEDEVDCATKKDFSGKSVRSIKKCGGFRMNDLEMYREQLALCDDKIIDALVERNAIIEKIMAYKETYGMPILQPAQEASRNAD